MASFLPLPSLGGRLIGPITPIGPIPPIGLIGLIPLSGGVRSRSRLAR
jgi:hypothetical protein